MSDDSLRTGVIGVGSMGRNHARVYRELAESELVGIADADQAAAATAATKFGIDPFETADLLDQVDAVSVAVPTHAHAPVVLDCIEAGVDVLVEKPFVDAPVVGREIASTAEAAGVTLQVGHIERFNPAVRTLLSAFSDLSINAVTAERLGPPVERDIGADVTFDLMIHDIDLLCTLLGEEPTLVSAAGVADGEYATSTWAGDDVVASLTASRITHERVRRLTVTAAECRVVVDLLDQTVEVHRRSSPEYVAADGDVRHRIESVVERPFVESGEPLKRELASFIDAAANGTAPEVTAEDGIRAVELASQVTDRLEGEPQEVSQ